MELEDLRITAEKRDITWIGCDPGQKDVMTIYKEEEDGAKSDIRGNSKNFSNARYYAESSFKCRLAKVILYTRQNNLENWSLSTPSLKYGNTNTVMRYLSHVLSAEFGTILEMVCSKKYKKLRWKCYIDNKRTIHQFCQEIIENCILEQTIVCFGDASFRHNSAGYASSPKQAHECKGTHDKRVQLKSSMFAMYERETIDNMRNSTKKQAFRSKMYRKILSNDMES
jgi:hypothetical protein